MASPFVRTGADGNLYAPTPKRSIQSDPSDLFSPEVSVPSTIADEPNGTVIVVGGSVSGAVDFAGDQDRYNVSLTAGQTYVFSLRGTGANAINDAFLSLVNPGITTFVASDDDGGNDLNSLFTYTAAETGIYQIRAQSFANPGDDGLGTYTLDVRVQGVDAVGDTNATAIAIGLGTTFGFREAGSDDVPPAPFLAGDLDRYAVNLVAGQYYTFKLAGGADYATDPNAVPTGELDTFLILRNAAGSIWRPATTTASPATSARRSAFTRSPAAPITSRRDRLCRPDRRLFAGVRHVDLDSLDPLDAVDWDNANDVHFVTVAGVRTAYVYFGQAGETFGQTADDGVTPMTTFGWQQHESER